MCFGSKTCIQIRFNICLHHAKDVVHGRRRPAGHCHMEYRKKKMNHTVVVPYRDLCYHYIYLCVCAAYCICVYVILDARVEMQKNSLVVLGADKSKVVIIILTLCTVTKTKTLSSTPPMARNHSEPTLANVATTLLGRAARIESLSSADFRDHVRVERKGSVVAL